ncbi:YybS family protein [Lentibacillus saliphilus]|uniref:YybS family protein n=1 Tax=Lentibacillus saliphilus TaxID=2737028 RepID=UPI001C2F182E|nr:YybS family protein [Lentibacillus saliphilus]
MHVSKKITDGALMTVVFIVLLIMAIFVPVLNLFATFVLPVPFVLYAAKYDWKAVGIMFIVAHLLAILFGTFFSIPVAALAAFGGIMIGTAINKKLSPYETWASGTIGFIIGLVIAFVFSQVVLDVNWIAETDQMIDESLAMSEQIMTSVGLSDQATEQMAVAREMFESLTDYLPVALAVMAIFMAFVTQWFSYKVINRLETRKLRFPPFRSMRLPSSLIWVYFIALIAGLLVKDGDSFMLLATQNALLLTGLLMTLQGFSFIFFYAHNKKMSKAIPITIVVISLLMPFVMLYIIRIIGIIDIGFGLRDRLSNDQK